MATLQQIAKRIRTAEGKKKKLQMQLNHAEKDIKKLTIMKNRAIVLEEKIQKKKQIEEQRKMKAKKASAKKPIKKTTKKTASKSTSLRAKSKKRRTPAKKTSRSSVLETILPHVASSVELYD